jgi:hypothetical protein
LEKVEQACIVEGWSRLALERVEQAFRPALKMITFD